jgi:hypothetical protein
MHVRKGVFQPRTIDGIPKMDTVLSGLIVRQALRDRADEIQDNYGVVQRGSSGSQRSFGLQPASDYHKQQHGRLSGSIIGNVWIKLLTHTRWLVRRCFNGDPRSDLEPIQIGKDVKLVRWIEGEARAPVYAVRSKPFTQIGTQTWLSTLVDGGMYF